jgi:hypothetical protein
MTDLPTHSLRLTLSYSGTRVNLERIDRLEMIPSPDERVGSTEARAGSWVELRDADQRVLYQQILYNPIRFDVEVAEDPVSGQLRRQAKGRSEGIFELVIPDMPEAETIRVFASRPEAFDEPAVEVLRMALNDGELNDEAQK